MGNPEQITEAGKIMHPLGGQDGRLTPTFLIMTPERVGRAADAPTFWL